MEIIGFIRIFISLVHVEGLVIQIILILRYSPSENGDNWIYSDFYQLVVEGLVIQII